MDQFELFMFDASYGGVAIDVLNTADDLPRSLVSHEYANRNGAILEDMGAVARETRCVVVFMPRVTDNEETPNIFERFAAFVALLNRADRTALPFIHPITGTYDALPRDISFSNQAVDRDYLPINVTFVEQGLDPAAFELLENEDLTSPAATSRVASASLDLATTVGDATAAGIGADSITAANSWRDDFSKTARTINLELNALTNRINQATTDARLAQDVNRYPTLRAYNRLHGSLRRAAKAAIATAPKLQEILTKSTQPLLTILQTIYGGRVALQKFERVLDLNTISNPAQIPSGTQLTIEAP